MTTLIVQAAVGILACLMVQLVVATHSHHGARNGSESFLLSSLLGMDTFGLPRNETALRLLSNDNDTDSSNRTSILNYVTYPLVAIVNHKMNTLRALLTLPLRLMMAPVDAARALWRTKEAMQKPVDAEMLGRLHDDLHKLNVTPSPNGH